MLWDEFRWDLRRDRIVKTQNIFNFPDAQAGLERANGDCFNNCFIKRAENVSNEG